MKKFGLLVGSVLAGALALTGCSTNPVTGKREISLMGEGQEIQVGSQQYSPGRQMQGGDYVADPLVQRYVNKVGQRVASVSDRKLPYEFRVINASVPNAWALPGGKIAINRGLLTELKSEAELAAVLGHEVVHAAARHGAKGVTRGALSQLLVVGATIASAGKGYSDIAQVGANLGAQAFNTKYGRDAERESDQYGIQYMVRAGYDPQGAVDLQETFLELNKARRQDFISGLFASHPPTQERLANNKKLVASLNAGGESGRERYQKNIGRLLRTKPAYEAHDKARKAYADKDVNGARALLRRAISIEPNEGHFHSTLGDLELAEKNPRAALGHYNTAISKNDGFFYYHMQKGTVSEQLGDYRSASSALNRSLEILPTSNAYNSLGNIAKATNRRNDAIALYTKAVELKGPAGEAALGSLVEMDLPANPGKYLASKPQVGSDGSVSVLVKNATPRNVDGVVVKVVYPDSTGKKMLETSERVPGVLGAGKTGKVNLRLRVNPRFAGQVKSGVVRAVVSRR